MLGVRQTSGVGGAARRVRLLGKFPLEWNPVSHDTYIFTVPDANPNAAVTTTTAADFNAGLQPGETFVEAAGAAPGGDAACHHRGIGAVRPGPQGSPGPAAADRIPRERCFGGGRGGGGRGGDRKPRDHRGVP